MHKVEFDFIDGKLKIYGHSKKTFLKLLFTRDDTYRSFSVEANILAVEACASAHPLIDAQVVTFIFGDVINASVTITVPNSAYSLLVNLLHGFGVYVQAGPALSEDDLAAKGGS